MRKIVKQPKDQGREQGRKRVPIIGMVTAESDKSFKRAEHSRERWAVKVALQIGKELPSPRLFGNPALGWKDGKQYAPDLPLARRK